MKNKKWLAALLAILLALSPVSTMTTQAAGATQYLDANGVMATSPAATADYNGGLVLGTSGTTSWFVVSGTHTITNTIVIKGDVHLILADGCSLTVAVSISNYSGINVAEPNSLTIYAQSTGSSMGYLAASGAGSGAGIGGNYQEHGGAVTINGGNIVATSGNYGAGIGGGMYGDGGLITINGGNVTARSVWAGAGIGSGTSGNNDTVIINGGNVIATGGNSGAGIGSGAGSFDKGNGGVVMITGGNVNANGGVNAAGIGSGSISVYGHPGGRGASLVITGGNVEVSSIGGGFNTSSKGGTTTITGGNVTVAGPAPGMQTVYYDGSGTTLFAVTFRILNISAIPIQGVSVSEGGANAASTNAAGRATLFLPGGTHNITLALAGYVTKTIALAGLAQNEVINTTLLSPRPEDINIDGDVNILDLSILLANFGKSGEEINYPRADINGDGDVNILDLSSLLAEFGK